MPQPFGDLQPLPGPFGTHFFTARLRLPWEEVPRLQQAVNQAANQSGVQAQVRVQPRGDQAEAEIEARGDRGGLSEFVRLVLAIGSALSAILGAALHGALAFVVFRSAEGIAGIVEGLGAWVQREGEQGTLPIWLILGGTALILLTRR